MKRSIMVIVILLIVLVSLVSAVDTFTITYQPTHGKDVTADWNNPTEVQSFLTTFCSPRHTFFIEFTQLEELINQNVEIHSAELGLWVSYIREHGKYRVEFCEEPWNSKTLTWYNQPEWSAEHSLRSDPELPRGVTEGWETIDVTEYVQKWVAGTEPHYGFVVAHNNTDGFFSIMDSDYTAWNEPHKFPYLKVTYTPIVTLVSEGSGGMSFEIPNSVDVSNGSDYSADGFLGWSFHRSDSDKGVCLARLEESGSVLEAILACSSAGSRTQKEEELKSCLDSMLEETGYIEIKSRTSRLDSPYVYSGIYTLEEKVIGRGSGGDFYDEEDVMHVVFLSNTNGNLYHLEILGLSKEQMIEIAESVRLP